MIKKRNTKKIRCFFVIQRSPPTKWASLAQKSLGGNPDSINPSDLTTGQEVIKLIITPLLIIHAPEFISVGFSIIEIIHYELKLVNYE